ncbi:MAG: hypothetical protein EBU92_05325 [Betaproteobacteria bacterium]|nr:hypothetical protein [Betaproteobacteria bacterium]
MRHVRWERAVEHDAEGVPIVTRVEHHLHVVPLHHRLHQGADEVRCVGDRVQYRLTNLDVTRDEREGAERKTMTAISPHGLQPVGHIPCGPQLVQWTVEILVIDIDQWDIVRGCSLTTEQASAQADISHCGLRGFRCYDVSHAVNGECRGMDWISNFPHHLAPRIGQLFAGFEDGSIDTGNTLTQSKCTGIRGHRRALGLGQLEQCLLIPFLHDHIGRAGVPI